MNILIAIIVFLIAATVTLIYFEKKGKIDDENKNIIPDRIEEAAVKTKKVIKETVSRTKNVVDESKDVIDELGDVVDAAKGKPTKKKYYYNSKKKK